MNENKLPPYPLGGTPEEIREWVSQYNHLFPQPQEFRRERIAEWINEETGEYEKNRGVEECRYKLYLRFIKTHFIPCDDCQTKLNDLIYNAQNFYLGNKSYEPAIEMNKQWVIDDDSWIELEKREATKEDFKRLYKHKWKEYWESHKEALTNDR